MLRQHLAMLVTPDTFMQYAAQYKLKDAIEMECARQQLTRAPHSGASWRVRLCPLSKSLYAVPAASGFMQPTRACSSITAQPCLQELPLHTIMTLHGVVVSWRAT